MEARKVVQPQVPVAVVSVRAPRVAFASDGASKPVVCREREP
jgi:hypothetical protein